MEENQRKLQEALTAPPPPPPQPEPVHEYQVQENDHEENDDNQANGIGGNALELSSKVNYMFGLLVNTNGLGMTRTQREPSL